MRDLHQGRLLLHLAQIFSLLQGPTTPTTVHLMHPDPEVVARATILTVLRNLPQSQLEDALLVGSLGTGHPGGRLQRIQHPDGQQFSLRHHRRT